MTRRIEAKHGSTFRSAIVSPTAVDANGTASLQTLLSFDACDHPCDAPPPENITVHVDYDDPQDDVSFTDIVETVKVYLQWGMCEHVARADLVRGMAITLAGSRVIVGIEYPTRTYTLAGQVPNPQRQPQIRVKASLGLDGTGSSNIARFTQLVGTVNAGAISTPIRIPLWADRVVLMTDSVLVPALNLLQFADPQQALTLSSADVGKSVVNAVPVAPGALFFSFFNAAAAPVTGVRAVFYLALP